MFFGTNQGFHVFERETKSACILKGRGAFRLQVVDIRLREIDAIYDYLGKTKMSRASTRFVIYKSSNRCKATSRGEFVNDFEGDRPESLSNSSHQKGAFRADNPTIGVPSEPIRVLLAGEQPLFWAGIRVTLERIGDIQVVGEARGSQKVLAALAVTAPQVVLAEIGAPKMTGLFLTNEINRVFPECKVVFFDDSPKKIHALLALRNGGSGYLPKNAYAAELETAVRSVADGHLFLSPSVVRDFVTDLTKTDAPTDISVDSLSPRQLQILQLIAKSLTAKEIAARLGLSSKTVETHRSLIMTKLGIHKVAGLVRYAVRHNFDVD